jgi:hypothetical protein
LTGCITPDRGQIVPVSPGEIRPGKSQATINDNPIDADSAVIQAGGAAPRSLFGTEQRPTPSQPGLLEISGLAGAKPRDAATPPAGTAPAPAPLPASTTKTPHAATTETTPPKVVPSAANTPGPRPLDPQVRGTPTASGAILNLAPYEVPADRLVELARKNEIQVAEIASLLARIREMEAVATSREHSIAETHRESEAQRADAARARSELAAVQAQLEQVQKEDIEILRAVVAALERLLEGPSGRREP